MCVIIIAAIQFIRFGHIVVRICLKSIAKTPGSFPTSSRLYRVRNMFEHTIEYFTKYYYQYQTQPFISKSERSRTPRPLPSPSILLKQQSPPTELPHHHPSKSISSHHIPPHPSRTPSQSPAQIPLHSNPTAFKQPSQKILTHTSPPSQPPSTKSPNPCYSLTPLKLV